MTNSVSFLIRAWREPRSGATHLRILEVDGETEVRLADAVFLVRLAAEADGTTQRCCVRHVASGREAYVQCSPELDAFIAECVFAGSGAP